MPNLNLATIRAMNASLTLRTPQLPSDLDAIRRIADSGDPIPPWLVRSLCDRAEAVEHLARAYLDAATASEASVARKELRAAISRA